MHPIGEQYCTQQRFSHAVCISRPAIKVFSAWTDLARRPSRLLQTLDAFGREQQVNVIKAPCIGEPSALLVDQIPGVFIAWRSLPHARVRENGEVWFHQTSDADMTEVRITLLWEVAQGAAAESTLDFEHVRAKIAQHLDAFRRLVEQ